MVLKMYSQPGEEGDEENGLLVIYRFADVAVAYLAGGFSGFHEAKEVVDES